MSDEDESEMWTGFPSRVLVINMEKDTARLEKTMREFHPFGNLIVERSPGIGIPDFPACATFYLTKSKFARVGTLGCFMAHLKAWERALEIPGWTLVIEDDIILTGFDRLSKINIPKDAELVFVNFRADPLRNNDCNAPVEILPASSLLKCMVERPNIPPGGEGYLLSRAGAKKLIDRVFVDGFNGHVDWRLLRYSVGPKDVLDVSKDTWLESAGTIYPKPIDDLKSWNVVRSYCLSPSVIKCRPEKSTREELDKLNISP